MEPPSPSRSFLLFRSFLHFIQNMRIISLLRMTGHPLILLSFVLPESFHSCFPSPFSRAFQVPSQAAFSNSLVYFLHLFLDYRKWKRYRNSSKAGRSFTDERRLKGEWQDVPSQPESPSAGRFDGRWKEEGRNRFPLVGRKNAVIFMDSVIARQAISGISRLLLIFLPLLRWIQRNSRQQ